MTFEVEQKFRLADPTVLERRLLELGAVPEPPITQSDCYLSHPCRDFGETDEALRIRTIGDQSRLTYKGPVLTSGVKTRREIEIPLGDAERSQQFTDVFHALGFRPVLTVAKHRRPFHLDWHGRRFEVALDTVPPLGDFLELETLAESADLPTAQTAVHELAAALGLDTIEEQTYLEMMLAEAARRNAT